MKNVIIKQLGLGSFWSVSKELTKKIGLQQAALLQHFIDLQFNIFNGDEFFQQQERIMEEFGLGKTELSNIIKKLNNLDLIKITKKGLPAKNYYFVNTDKIIEILNEDTPTPDDSQNIQSNEVKSVEVIDNTIDSTKVPETEENQDEIEFPTTIFKQNKVEIKKIELNQDLLTNLLDEPEPDMEFLDEL